MSYLKSAATRVWWLRTLGEILPWDSIPVLAHIALSKHPYCSNLCAKSQLESQKVAGRYAPARIRTEISSFDKAAPYPLDHGGIPNKFSTVTIFTQTGGNYG